jgi:hypothetical protein
VDHPAAAAAAAPAAAGSLPPAYAPPPTERAEEKEEEVTADEWRPDGEDGEAEDGSGGGRAPQSSSLQPGQPLRYGLILTRPDAAVGGLSSSSSGRNGPLGIPEHIVKARQEAWAQRQQQPQQQPQQQRLLSALPTGAATAPAGNSAADRERRLAEMMAAADEREAAKRGALSTAAADKARELAAVAGGASSGATGPQFLASATATILGSLARGSGGGAGAAGRG